MWMRSGMKSACAVLVVAILATTAARAATYLAGDLWRLVRGVELGGTLPTSTSYAYISNGGTRQLLRLVKPAARFR